MAATVLPQLEEIISDIAEQESSLEAQLAETKAKLEAIRSVLSLFDGSDVAAPAQAAPATSKASEKALEKASEKAPSVAKSTAKSTAKAKTTRKTKTESKGTKAKKDGRAASWQKYTREGVGDQPMPESVRLILATQPSRDFKIAEVMSSLFSDEMPKNQYLKARNRVSNILSGGVRSGDWYKGERGAYRLTEKSS